MSITIVGWHTNGLLFDVFSCVDVPQGLQWYPGHEVDGERELTLTIEHMHGEPTLIMTPAREGALRSLGAWMHGRTGELSTIETAVLTRGWNDVLDSLDRVVEWPKWPLAWFPMGDETERTQVRLRDLLYRIDAGTVRRTGAFRTGRTAAIMEVAEAGLS